MNLTLSIDLQSFHRDIVWQSRRGFTPPRSTTLADIQIPVVEVHEYHQYEDRSADEVGQVNLTVSHRDALSKK